MLRIKAVAKAINTHMPTAVQGIIPTNREAIPPNQSTATTAVSKRLGDVSPLCPTVLARQPNTAPAEYPANVKNIKANQLRMFIDLFEGLSLFRLSSLFR
jgi:hypothetical protein